VKQLLYYPLTEKGFKVFWHLSDFIAGLTIAENMVGAIQRSRWIIFVCSRQFEQSTLWQQELRLGLNNHYSNYKGKYRRVIPLIIEEGACPKNLKQLYPIKYIQKHSTRFRNQHIKHLIQRLHFGELNCEKLTSIVYMYVCMYTCKIATGKPLEELKRRAQNRTVRRPEDSISLISNTPENFL